MRLRIEVTKVIPGHLKAIVVAWIGPGSLATIS